MNRTSPDETKREIYRLQKRLQRNRDNWSHNKKLEVQTRILLLKKLLKTKIAKNEEPIRKPSKNDSTKTRGN